MTTAVDSFKVRAPAYETWWSLCLCRCKTLWTLWRNGHKQLGWITNGHTSGTSNKLCVRLNFVTGVCCAWSVCEVFHGCSFLINTLVGLYVCMWFCRICSLCLNQHRDDHLGSADQLKKEFGDRVMAIGRILPMLEKWDDAGYVKRAWCLFEVRDCLCLTA